MKVKVASSRTCGSKKYHTDHDCVQLPEDPREFELSELGDKWTECGYCSGAHKEKSKNQDGKTECPYCKTRVYLTSHLSECEAL